MILAPVIRQFFGYANVNLVGGKLYSYVAGTTTPQATYTDQSGATPNANPVVLDANGSASVWIDPTLAYKFVLDDSLGNLIFTVDQVSSASGGGAPEWSGSSNYSQGNIVADQSGAGLLYVSIQDNNIGNDLTNVSYWRMFGGATRTVTANTTLLVTDELVRSNSTSGNIIHTLPACATTPIGKKITVKDVGTGGFGTSVKGSGSDPVDGSNTYGTILASQQSASFENNGTAWDALSVVAYGSVTQAKLAARSTGTTVGAGGVAISASCGNFITSSTTPVAVTNLSVTITTTGRPVMLMLQPDGGPTNLSGYNVGNNPLAFAGGRVSIFRGSTQLTLSQTSILTGTSQNLGLQSFPTYAYVDAVAAGTYTYSVQAYCPSSGIAISVGFISLVAFEL